MQFEIHVTVETAYITEFINNCDRLGLKPLIIETQNGSEFGNQIMTSNVWTGESYEERLAWTVKGLEEAGYKIIRKKVEIQPEETKHKDFLYYETHFRIKVPKNPDPVAMSLLNSKCKTFNWYLSKNLLKRSNIEFNYLILTRRTYGMSLDVFKAVDVEGMKTTLNNLEIEFDKVEIEECIYDSNVSIDDSWLKPKKATIFGGSRSTKKPTPEYLETIELGSRLAAAGYVVKTGGYGGIMEAASKGCRERNGVAIGYTCKTFPTTQGNEYLTNTVVAEDIFDRLRMLISDTDLFIVQKGGLGTFAELFLTLDICRKMQNPPKIILIGEHWFDIMGSMEHEFSAKEFHLYEIVLSVEQLNIYQYDKQKN